MLGMTTGIVMSVFREQIVSLPLVGFLDAIGLWAFYLSSNLLVAGLASTIYMGGVFYLVTMLLVRGRFSVMWGLIGGLALVHVVLIWRLDVLLAPSIGEGFRLWFSR